MATMDRFVGFDSNNNPITEQYHFHGDSRYTARSEEAADISNWNMMLYQNEYNDPSNQLQRIKDAGLNPLFYLGGNAGTVEAASGGSASGHSMTSGSGAAENAIAATKNVSDSLLETQRQAQQYDIARRQLDIQDRQTGIAEKQLGLNERKTAQDIEESQSRVRLNEKSVDELASKISLNKEQENQLRSLQAVQAKQLDEMTATIDNLKSSTAQNWAQVKRIYKLTPAEYDRIASETNLNYHQANVEVEKMFNFMADTEKKSVEIDVGRGQKVLLERQTDGQIYTNYLLSKEADWAEAEHEAKVVTAYWQAANGSLNAVANTINATGSAMFNGARALGRGPFNSQTIVNPPVAAPGVMNSNYWMP